MKTFPCEIGLVCPFCHYDEDGMEYCSWPDRKPKRNSEYDYICNLEELDCELIGSPDSPLGQLLQGFEEIRNEPMAYRRTKVDVSLKNVRGGP